MNQYNYNYFFNNFLTTLSYTHINQQLLIQLLSISIQVFADLHQVYKR